MISILIFFRTRTEIPYWPLIMSEETLSLCLVHKIIILRLELSGIIDNVRMNTHKTTQMHQIHKLLSVHQ